MDVRNQWILQSTTDEEFWENTICSTLVNFSFDGEKDFDKSLPYMQNPLIKNPIPIDKLISTPLLTKVLDDNYTEKFAVVDVEAKFKQLFLDTSSNRLIANCKTLDEKTSLLHEAVVIGDGDLILEIILHLHSLLQRNVFNFVLSQHMYLLEYYINYLIWMKDNQRIAELYGSDGYIHLDKILYFLAVSNCKNNPQNLHIKLEQIKLQCYGTILSSEEFDEGCNYMHFLKWQVQNEQYTYETLVGHLSQICIDNWQSSVHDSTDFNLYEFKNLFQIDDAQFDWIIMTTLVELKMWNKLISSDVFFQTSWIPKKKETFHSEIHPNLIINYLTIHQCPTKFILRLQQFSNVKH